MLKSSGSSLTPGSLDPMDPRALGVHRNATCRLQPKNAKRLRKGCLPFDYKSGNPFHWGTAKCLVSGSISSKTDLKGKLIVSKKLGSIPFYYKKFQQYAQYVL